MLRLPIAALLFALAGGSAFAEGLDLKGASGQAVHVTAGELAAMPRTGFTFDAHGVRHAYDGVALIDLLAKVGAPTGKALGGPALATAVRVTASDGYQVVFGLGETDPGTRPNRIIVADRADSAPLDAKEGPLRLVVEGDLRPARSARGVISIEVIDLRSPGPRPH